MQDNRLIKAHKNLFQQLNDFSEGYTDQGFNRLYICSFFLTEKGFVLSTGLDIPSIYEQFVF